MIEAIQKAAEDGVMRDESSVTRVFFRSIVENPQGVKLKMIKYESVIIARQDLGASQVNNLVDELKNVIANQGGEVVRVDNWGLKNLAYRIKKNRKGHYVLLNISAPASAVAEYERVMRVNEDIIRYITVRVEEFTETSSNNDGVDSAVEE